jgi:hypothetical protein
MPTLQFYCSALHAAILSEPRSASKRPLWWHSAPCRGHKVCSSPGLWCEDAAMDSHSCSTCAKIGEAEDTCSTMMAISVGCTSPRLASAQAPNQRLPSSNARTHASISALAVSRLRNRPYTCAGPTAAQALLPDCLEMPFQNIPV